jgi:transposase
MARRYGRSPSGCRAHPVQAQGADPPLTLVGVIRLGGVGAFRELEGAINGHAFLGFVEPLLVPTRRPGDQVWLDNLISHHVAGVQEAMEAQPAELHFLPPYSSEYSPIERLWAKLKAWLRGAAARSREALDGELLNALDEITEKDIKGWFKHCGFRTEPG